MTKSNTAKTSITILGSPNMLLRLIFEQLEQSKHFEPRFHEEGSPLAQATEKPAIALVLLDSNDSNAGTFLNTSSSFIPPMHTVILSNCNNVALLHHWRANGYERIVSTNAPFSELLVCLQQARDGEPYHCSTIKKLTSHAKRGPLSVREHEVFELLVKGSTNKNIAMLLGVGEKSVHTYRKRLMEKLSCSSLAELILYAQQSQKF